VAKGYGVITGQTGQRLCAAGPPAGHAVGTGETCGVGVTSAFEPSQALKADPRQCGSGDAIRRC